ncbi:unnamed protein product [Ixodes hexagonus]
MTQEQRQQGGVVFHFIIVIYLCGVLGYICDDYFVPSLEIIADSEVFFCLSPDVAGATFMAIGTSAPELFSSIIGSFITEGDIGVGTIVGSAVFNILGVTGVAGIAVWKDDVPIDWFPITRDCLMYAVTVVALIGVISNNIVEWYEALILILMFLAYIVVLFFNAHIEYYSLVKVREDTHTMRSRSIRSSTAPKLQHDVTSLASAKQPLLKPPLPRHSLAYTLSFSKRNQERLPQKNAIAKRRRTVERHFDTPSMSFYVVTVVQAAAALCIIARTSRFGGSQTSHLGDLGHRGMSVSPSASPHSLRLILIGVLSVSLSVCKLEEQEEQESLWSMPREGSVGQVLWVLFWPVRLLLHFTVPDCRKESLRRWYPLTFFLSVVWIGAVSYLTVWMVTIIGYTIGIPDSVAGITVLAAGTSVPEVFSSVIVARNGLGNMAICNLLGSNIFDVLFCLGVPWFLKAVFASKSHEVFINSAAMTYTSVTLLSTVVLLFGTFVITRWKLNYKVGFACIIMYIIFITLACMYELNVFGDFNPPTCT